MSKSLYEMYQEKVGVNLKGLNEIIDEVLFLCEEEINKGNSLPYMFMIENTSDDSFKLFSLYMSTKGVIANMSIPYKSNGVPYVSVWVNNMIPQYFIYKMKHAKTHQFMQVGRYVLMRTSEYLLYKLPDGSEVYGGDEKVLITDYESDFETYLPEYYHPKNKEWVVCKAAMEKDWLFSISNLQYGIQDCEFSKICYDSDDGWIEFDVLAWIQKNISNTFTADEDFYYYGRILFNNMEFDIGRCFDGYGVVKSARELTLVCHREVNVHNIKEDLKRYFSKVKLPTQSGEVYKSIQDGSMSLEDFLLWVRNGN